MPNEARPYPGFSAMLEEFQDLFADWVLAGYPSADYVLPGGKHHQQQSGYWYHYDLYLSSNSATIQIVATYAKKPGFIFSSSTIDTSAVASFCQRNHLEYRIASHRDLPETLFIFGTPLNFLNSELNGNLLRSRQRAQSLVPLAQKFYEWDGMNRIRFTINDENNRSRIRQSNRHPLVVYAFSAGYDGYRDDEGYTYPGVPLIHFYSDGGYRNLQSEDEIIAFTIAVKACEWNTEPKLIDWSKILWNIRFKNGELRLTNMPTFQARCPYTDPPLKPQPTPQPTYKDFF